MRMPKGRRGSVIAKIAASALAVYVAVLFVSVEAKVDKARAQQAELAKLRAEKQQQVAYLKDLTRGVPGEDYIIKTARERFGYLLPGESIYIDVNGK
ncbi:MAG: septum formation initiator family protein [Clostridia bacterium]|nr:septum formation initiator family protein [Clostridia bacterium]